MSALKVFVLVAVVLCVHALMVDAQANRGPKRKKQQTSPRQQGNQPQANGNHRRNQQQGNPRRQQQGKQGNPSGKRKAAPPRKQRRSGRKPRPPPPPPPPGRRAGRPRAAQGGRPRARKPDPAVHRHNQCLRMMVPRSTNKDIKECQDMVKDNAKQENHITLVNMCLLRKHELIDVDGKPVVDKIEEHIDKVNEHLSNNDLAKELKAEVTKCSNDLKVTDDDMETFSDFRTCIINFCKGEKQEEAEEKSAEE